MDSTVLSAITSAFSILTPLLLAFAFVWAIWRTESRHVLIRRLWQLVHGNQEIVDPQVRSFVHEQTSLVSFRMFAGVPVSSLDEAHRLIQWAKLNGVQMRTLRLCGEYFDAEQRQVRVHKLPGRHWQVAKLVGLAITVAVGVMSFISFPSDRSLLALKATQRPFLATGTEARAFWPPWPFNAAPLRVTDCSMPASANAARTSFTEQEVDLLCGVLKTEGTSSYMKDALKGQRWTLVLFMLVSGWFSWFLLFAWGSAAAAKNLAQRNVDSSLSGSQLSFDWRS